MEPKKSPSWKGKSSSQPPVFGIHVNLPGCIWGLAQVVCFFSIQQLMLYFFSALRMGRLAVTSVTVTTSRLLLMKDPGSFIWRLWIRWLLTATTTTTKKNESQVHFGGVCILTLSHHCNPMVLYESPCPGDCLGKNGVGMWGFGICVENLVLEYFPWN